MTQKPTDKPFRNEDLLKLPVVTKDMTGRLFTQRVKSISDVIGHYNTSYFALRLCVAPEKVERAKEVLASFQGGITPENVASEVRKTEAALERATQNPGLNVSNGKAANGAGPT